MTKFIFWQEIWKLLTISSPVSRCNHWMKWDLISSLFSVDLLSQQLFTSQSNLVPLDTVESFSADTFGSFLRHLFWLLSNFYGHWLPMDPFIQNSPKSLLKIVPTTGGNMLYLLPIMIQKRRLVLDFFKSSSKLFY